MKKKERLLARSLDRKFGLRKGTHEFFIQSNPSIKSAIIGTAKKEKSNA